MKSYIEENEKLHKESEGLEIAREKLEENKMRNSIYEQARRFNEKASLLNKKSGRHWDKKKEILETEMELNKEEKELEELQTFIREEGKEIGKRKEELKAKDPFKDTFIA